MGSVGGTLVFADSFDEYVAVPRYVGQLPAIGTSCMLKEGSRGTALLAEMSPKKRSARMIVSITCARPPKASEGSGLKGDAAQFLNAQIKTLNTLKKKKKKKKRGPPLQHDALTSHITVFIASGRANSRLVSHQHCRIIDLCEAPLL